MADNKKECSNSSCTKESCENCPSRTAIPKEPCNKYSSIKNVIGVVSGKGGVGKSTVTAMLARKLINEGYKVGILDADVTGPSIPKLFGLKGKLYQTEEGINPMVSAEGVKIISMNLLLDSEEDAVIWRGPVIAGIIKQFWSEVYWGELDFLLVDMPPGTGDVPLTVYQSLPINGIVVVTSPQDLVKMIVMKAFNMAEKMNVKVLGLVENYSYFECTECGKKLKIFGESGIDELADKLNVPVLAKLPIVPEIAQAEDAGVSFDELVKMNMDPFKNL